MWELDVDNNDEEFDNVSDDWIVNEENDFLGSGEYWIRLIAENGN